MNDTLGSFPIDACVLEIGSRYDENMKRENDAPVDRQFCTNLARGLKVLRCFGPRDDWLSNKEIAERSGLPRPTVSRLTYTLVSLGYLSFDVRVRKYALGTGVLTIAYPLLASIRIRQIARPFMESLAQTAGGSVSVGVRDQLKIVYIETCRAPQGELTLPDVGLILPLAESAVGRAYLAMCSRDERRMLLNQLRVADPARSGAMLAGIRSDQEHYARHGFSRSYGEVRPDVNAVGVALRDEPSGEDLLIQLQRSGPAGFHQAAGFRDRPGARGHGSRDRR